MSWKDLSSIRTRQMSGSTWTWRCGLAKRLSSSRSSKGWRRVRVAARRRRASNVARAAKWSLLFWITIAVSQEDEAQEGGSDEAASTDADGGHAVFVEHVFHYFAEGEGLDDFRDDDAAVEDAHPQPRVVGPELAREEGVGEGQDGGPRDTDRC